MPQLNRIFPEKKKSALKSPNISNFFRQRSGYISDFTLIYPVKNLADLANFFNWIPFLNLNLQKILKSFFLEIFKI